MASPAAILARWDFAWMSCTYWFTVESGHSFGGSELAPYQIRVQHSSERCKPSGSVSQLFPQVWRGRWQHWSTSNLELHHFITVLSRHVVYLLRLPWPSEQWKCTFQRKFANTGERLIRQRFLERQENAVTNSTFLVLDFSFPLPLPGSECSRSVPGFLSLNL
jgi:hypothetical protein